MSYVAGVEPPTGPLHVVVLVKQVPRFEAMELGPDGRLRREGLDLELNPYCRRAVSKGVELARLTGGTCTVITLGPPAAGDSLREAIAWGATGGVLVTDPAFAGSDTLATSRALAAALRTLPPADVVLTGRNSVDADTAQVPPQLAELLGLPFLAGVRELDLGGGAIPTLFARCEHDDGWMTAEVALPVLISCAERLCEPAKVDPAGRAAVSADRIRVLSAADLGAGPWGQEGSPTHLGRVRTLALERLRLRLEGGVDEQVRRAVELLEERGAIDARAVGPGAQLPDGSPPSGPVVAVVVEPDRTRSTRELLGAAAHLAAQIGGSVTALAVVPEDAAEVGAWGADHVVHLHGAALEEDVARVLTEWMLRSAPWAVLVPSTMWGREVAARAAARTASGLIGDAVDVDVADGRLVGWKPAFGGGLVAAITCSSAVQMVTVRPGTMALAVPRTWTASTETMAATVASRVRVLERTRDDDLTALATAHAVVAVGTGVPPEAYPALRPLLDALGAEMAGTRKVTDRGWLPRSRQVGITGRAIAPTLVVEVGASGRFNHAIGLRAAGFVLAINNDASAPIFDLADAGIVGDWAVVVPRLAQALLARRAAAV